MTCRLLTGDAESVLRTLPDASIQCCVTSPPYWNLRDYGCDGQIGLEDTPNTFIARLMAVFMQVHRVLRPDGTLWINISDSYFGDSPVRKTATEAFSGTWDTSQTRSRGGTRRSAAAQDGLRRKSLCGVPWRLAFALMDAGWILRSDIIWDKPAPMPSSATDRPTNAHEYLFLLAKQPSYYYDTQAIAEPVVKGAAGSSFTNGKTGVNGAGRVSQLNRVDGTTRNKRDVWRIASASFEGAHYAVMPAKLVEPCILAGSREGDTVLDPFSGTSTVGAVALAHGRSYIGIDLDPRNRALAEQRIGPMLLEAVS